MGLATDKLRATVDRSFPGFADKMQAAQQAGGDLGRRQEAALQAGSSAGQRGAPARTTPPHPPRG